MISFFRNKLHIVFNQIYGEANDVNANTIEELKTKLHKIIEGYDPKDIVNGDETSLFYKALPCKSPSLKEERCAGGK